MGVQTVSLEGVRNLSGVLARLPQGEPARVLAEKMGLWSTAIHNTADTNRRQAFPNAFARLSDAEVSDQNAYWLSEVFRVTELVGLLEGQKTMLTMQAKATRASVRANLRRKYRQESAALVTAGKAAPKDPSATQLADEVEEDGTVMECDAALAMLAIVAEQAKAYKEACLAVTAGLSREISFRQAQMGARLR